MRGQSNRKANDNTTPAQTILPQNEADESGERDCKILFPAFSKRNGTAKIQTVKGLRVEIILDNNRAERSIKPFVIGRNYVPNIFMYRRETKRVTTQRFPRKGQLINKSS